MNLFDLCVYKNLNKGSGGDVDVSSLVATENKTYNAGEGKAYNPVVVNVPTPPPSLQSLTASHNGYFVPSSGYDGFDEVTVDVATPLETLNATENGTYTPSSGYEGFSEVTVDVPLPNNAYLLESQKDDVVTIQHGAEFEMPKLIASIEPQQDLHGYDSPWAGGAGKNKLPLPAEQTINGVTLTHLSDGSIKLTGTPTANTYFDCFAGTFDSTAYAGYRFKVSYTGSSSGILFRMSKSDRVTMQELYDNSLIADTGSGLYFALRVAFDTTIPSSGIIIYPMLLSPSETNYDFAPYSNICPISGWNEANVTRCGANLLDESNLTPYYIDTDGTLVSNDSYRATDYLDFSNVNSIKYGVTKEDTGGWYYRIGCYNASKTFLGFAVNRTLSSGVYKGVADLLNNTNYIRVCWVNSSSNRYIYDNATYNTYTIDLGGTRYGGTLDVLSGVLTVDRAMVTVDENSDIILGSGGLPFRIDLLTGAKASSSASALTGVKCNFLKEVAQSSSWGVDGTFSRVTTDAKIVYFKVNSEITTVQQLKMFLQSNNLQLVYELATPQTYNLTPTQVIKSLLGVNNIFADTGEVDVQIWTKEV